MAKTDPDVREGTARMGRIAAADVARLAECAVVFEPADPPRSGTVAFFDPPGGGAPDAELPLVATADDTAARRGSVTVAVPAAGGVDVVTLPAVRLPAADAVPVLTAARRRPGAHRAAAFWGAVTLAALQVVARGRLLPGVSAAGFDAWRAGPLDLADVERLDALAAAMPPEARSVPVAGTSPPALPDAGELVRAFVGAVADGLPRSPAAPRAAGTSVFAATAPRPAAHLRPWAQEVSRGLDSGVRISLRVEATVDGSPDGRDAPFRAVVLARSLADPTLVVEAADLWRRADAAGFGGRARMDASVAVRRAAHAWPPLERLLRRPVPDQLELADGEVVQLLGDAASRLAAAGVEVHWPKELARALTAKAVVGRRQAPPSNLASFFGGDELLRFDWQLALGGEPLTDAEMDALAEAHRPIVKLRDQWVLVDPELARRARERELKPMTAVDALAAALTGTAEIDGEPMAVAAEGWLAALRERIADPDAGAEQVPQPAALAATLRDYQLRGLRWLVRMTSLGLGACLADDMGLGKTITLIALHLHRQADPATAGPTLVVCPTSLLGNWEREIERFAPGTPVVRYHGAARSLDAPELAHGGFVLTTYGTMRVDAERLAGPGERGWGLVVADEAQHVKNPLSGTAAALRTIGARTRVALTGTPVENNLSELWAILDWTTPGLLGPLRAFRRWARPVEAGEDPAAAERLARLVRPFLLRRRKSDPGIAPELPPKTETDHPVALTPEQAGLYEAVVREHLARIAAAEGIERRGLVLKLLTGLKQVCNHPAQFLAEASPRLGGRSGKLELLDELLGTILAEDGAALVFTQYVGMARLLERHLTARGVPHQLLHGGTPVAKREDMVQRFTDGEVPVFLLSLKAAGTGLNLTRADHVVHYDRWWNPAVEEQATDRAYRIGQTKPVQVHRLVTEGTVEERVATMLAAKRALADAVLAGGETALTELTDAELADLVALRRRP